MNLFSYFVQTKEIGNISDKQCSTTLSVPIENYDDEELMVELGTPKKRHKIASQFVAESTQGLFETMASPILHRNERLAIKNSIEIIDCLQNVY
jgi:hypothetical protein